MPVGNSHALSELLRNCGNFSIRPSILLDNSLHIRTITSFITLLETMNDRKRVHCAVECEGSEDCSGTRLLRGTVLNRIDSPSLND